MTKSWDDVKPEACRLYVQEGRTLSQVQNSLEERFNFKASARSFRLKFKEWGITRASRLQDFQARDQRTVQAFHGDYPEQESFGSIPEVMVIPDRSLSHPLDGLFPTSMATSPISSNTTLVGSPNQARLAQDRSRLLTPSRAWTAQESPSSLDPVRNAYLKLRESAIGSEVRLILNKASYVSGEDCILHYAAEATEHWTLEYIVDHMQSNDTNLDIVDSRQRTALEYAISAYQYSAVRLLLESGASVHRRNDEELQPLHYAIVEHAPAEIVDLLLRHGAPVDAPIPQKRGHTSSPVHLCVELLSRTPNQASRDRLCAIFEVLLEHRANVAGDDQDGKPTHTKFLAAWLRWESLHTFAQWKETKRSFRLSHYLRAGFDPLCWIPCKHCPGNECKSFASYIFAHTPNSGLADLLVRTVDVTKHGVNLLSTLLSPCSSRTISRTGTSTRELLNILLARMEEHESSGRPIENVLHWILSGAPEHEQLDLVEAVLAWEIVTLNERREALKLVPRMDSDSGRRLTELLLSGPDMAPIHLFEVIRTYFYGSGRVLLRNRVRELSPEFQERVLTILALNPAEMVEADKQCMMRCVMHVFTRALMESKTISFDVSTQQRVSGAIELRQEYGLPLLPVSGDLVLAMYPHLDHRRRGGRTMSESGQNGYHDDPETTIGNGSDSGVDSAYHSPDAAF